MKNSIQQIEQEFISNIEKYFSDGKNINIKAMEADLLKEAKDCAAKMTAAYIELVDRSLLENKEERREQGYAVERRGDERQIQTKIGEIRFARTYYYNRNTNDYAYLADQAVGLDSYARVSEGLGLALVSAAESMSYQKASEHLTNGEISRETVMHKIRESSATEPPIPVEKRRIKSLHIDADEAHIALAGGGKSIVPLISVYEGIERQGKRGKCRSVFYISEYGKTPDALWEQALNEIEKRYDLDGTQIYLHGDGGNWIKQGLNWLPDARFVLDKYHKNKAIKEMTAGLGRSARAAFDREIRAALSEADARFFDELTQSLISQVPERAEKIRNAAEYLKKCMSGIAICAQNAEANNGGATEPHVSHVLANRLSSRPMAWSKATLEKFAPILASSQPVRLASSSAAPQPSELHRKAVRAASAAFRCRKTAGFPMPDSIGKLPALVAGRSLSLFKTLKALS